MADFLGQIDASATIYIYFTTHAQTGAAVAPSTAFEAADVKLYKNGSATERSSQAGWTMTSPFDSITGLHCLAIDLSDNSDSGFYAAGAKYAAVLSPDETVDGLAVVRVLAYFNIGPNSANVTQWNGTAVASPATAGIPDVNVKNINNVAAATPGASGGVLISGTNSGTTTLGALTVSGTTTLAALAATTVTFSGAVAFQSTFAVTTSTSLGALSCTTLTASGAVAFQSTFATTGTTTFNALTVTNATTLSGAVSMGSTFSTTGTVTFNAFTVTNAFTVSGSTTLTGAVTASNASNNIVGIDVAKISGDATAADNAELFFDGTGYNAANSTVGTVTLVSTLTTYTGDTPQSGDCYPKVDTEVATIVTAVVAIQAKTDNLPSDPADESLIIAATDAIMSRIGVAGVGLTNLGDVRIANLDATVSSRLSSAGYTAPDNAGIAAILDDTGTTGVVVAAASKAGYALASTGLDAVATTAPAGVASNFREMLVQVWRRFFKKSTITATELKTFADDGATPLTTQPVSDDTVTQTQGTAV